MSEEVKEKKTKTTRSKKAKPVEKTVEKEGIQKTQDTKVDELIASAKEIITEKSSKPKSTRKRKINLSDEVEVVNFTNSNFFYRSPRSGRVYDFAKFGSTDLMSVDELRTMLSAYPGFLRAPWLLILDADVVDYLGLTSLYENIRMPRQIDQLFEMSAQELAPILRALPKGMYPLVASRAREKLASGKLDSMGVIKLLQETLGTDLGLNV